MKLNCFKKITNIKSSFAFEKNFSHNNFKKLKNKSSEDYWVRKKEMTRKKREMTREK